MCPYEHTTKPTQNERVDTGLFDELRRISTAAEVEELLDGESLTWQPLGDQENNVGIVRSGSSPAQALAERKTNGIDAVI